MTTDPADLAAAMTSSLTDGDLEGFAALFADSALVWHSPTERAIPVAEAVAVIEGIRRHIPDLHYEEVHVRRTEDGFVQQHRLCGTDLDGERFAAPTCIVATTADGAITRLDEYLDRSLIRRLVGVPR